MTANSTVPAKSAAPKAPAKKAAPAPAGAATDAPGGAADSAPVPAAPSAPAATTSVPRPVSEPEPIDLLEVAGGAAVARYAKPAAGFGVLLLLIFLLARRRSS